jgi:hypothetical protein
MEWSDAYPDRTLHCSKCTFYYSDIGSFKSWFIIAYNGNSYQVEFWSDAIKIWDFNLHQVICTFDLNNNINPTNIISKIEMSNFYQ